MDNDDRQYGRRRVKKPKPMITHPSEPPTGETPPVTPSQPMQPSVEPQTILPIPESPAVPEPGSPRVQETAEKPPAPPEPRRPDRAERPSRPERYRPKSEARPDRRPERAPARPQERPARKFAPEPHKTRVSIIIPAYNEEGNIRPLMEQFNEVISRSGSDWEVVLVNDGSTDRTADRAREAAIRYRWLRVVSYSHRGLTEALTAGFQNARGMIYVYYPADLQYHAQDLPRMIAAIDRGADLVAGWKQGKYSKRFVSYIYNWLCRRLFKVKIHDMNSIKAFKKEVVQGLTWRKDWHRYMVVLAAEAGFVVNEVKVGIYPRHSGQSKFKTGRIMGGVLDLFSVYFQIRFTKKPLRFFGTWGILFVLAGFMIGMVAVYLRFFTQEGSRLWLFLVILLVLSGLMLFSIGFLAEVIVALKEEVESLRTKK